jgi:prophage regulatory protein
MSDQILRLPEVIRRTGLSRASIYKGARLGNFPRPFKLTERASGWKLSEVDAWISSRGVSTGVESDPATATH